MSSRRTFLATSGAALAVIATSGGFRAVALAEAASSTTIDPTRLSAWLRIARDGTVDVLTGKVEIGMGTITGLAQLVADELDVPLTSIRMITGDTQMTPDQGGVGGSTSTELGALPLRHAAAEARAALVNAAAQHFGVAPSALDVREGVIHVRGDAQRSISYGDVIDALAKVPPLTYSGEGFHVDVRGAAKLKPSSEYTIVGKPVARFDVAPKVFGSYRFSVDRKVPGMLHARVVRPPTVGARLLSVDASSLQRHGDARVVRIGDFLAVVASREWHAVAGARDLQTRWSSPSVTFPPMDGLADAMWAMPVASHAKTIEHGDLAAASAGASIVEASYAWPFQSHATMGPGCAVADVRSDGVTVWCGGQKPNALQIGVAELLKVPLSSVRIIFDEDAGSYGRSGFDDTAADAVLISREVGKPVRVQYMRSDMTEWGPKAPAMVGRFRGMLRDGKMTGLDLTVRAFNGGEISSHPDSAGNFIGGQLSGHANSKPRVEYAMYGKNSAAYDLPALHAAAELVAPFAPSGSPLRTTHLRDPEGPGTTFLVESFIDEMASHAGVDPIAFRIAHLRDARAIGVLKRVSDLGGWRSGVAASAGRRSGVVKGRGVAFATRGKTMVATIAEVSVDTATGRVSVERLVCAHDCGLVVNPRSIRGTIEANLMQSMSRALIEEVRFEGGAVTSRDWLTYPVARTPDIPARVEIALVETGDEPPYGAGEPSSRPTAAAIGNAIFDATGARVRTAPFVPRNVLAALKVV